MLRRLFGFDWKNSQAHLLLLSKFRSPRDPNHYYRDENWAAALEEQPEKAIKRFVKDGMIANADLSGVLNQKYSVADLKGMLKERGLKVSGRKAELIERLIEADRETMARETRGLHVLQLTEAGEEIAGQYLEKQKEDRRRVEQFAMQALEERRFSDAARAVAAYEARQVFTRGIGVDWANYNPSAQVAMLDTVFSSKPKILGDVDDEELGHLRIAAGMSLLWGTNRVKSEWLSQGFSTRLHFDNSTAARMLIFHAYHRRNLEQYRSFTKTVEILTVEGSSCEACKRLAGKKYKIGSVPELPYEKCTHKMGCRCSITPANFT